MATVSTSVLIDFRFTNVTNNSYTIERYIKVEASTLNDAAQAAHIRYQQEWEESNGSLPTLFKLVTPSETQFYHIDPNTGTPTPA